MKPSAHKGVSKTSILRRYVPLISERHRQGVVSSPTCSFTWECGTAFAFIGKWMADSFGLPIGQIGTVMIFLGFGTLLGSTISSYAARKLGHRNAVTAGMAMLIVLYTVMPHLKNLPAVTVINLIIFATLGIIFPIVMGALTSLNASIRGTISSLANSTMNGANTLGAWMAGLLYVQLGGYSSIGIFSSVCLTFSLGMFLFGGILVGRKAAYTSQEPVSAS